MATKARLIYTADEDSLQKQRREFSIADELQQKIDSIEEGAQVNTIETIKVNGVALIPDENKAVDIEVPGVIDSLDSTSIDDALSARQGKILYEYIQNLGARGRYLSNWDCATGLPVTNPQENPYTYMTGDYFSVSNVATSPATNYRPDGTQYVAGQASQAVETDIVEVSDFYIYDGANWILLHNSSRTIAVDSSLSTTSTNPVENRVVTNAINSKADITYVDAHDTVVSSTAPSNPTQGMVWYDTTNDVLKTYDGTSWTGVGVECNTKTFYLSSTSDLTTAQAALDWYNDGKNPLIIYNNQCYIVRGVSPGHLYFGGQNAGGVQIDNIGYYNLVAQDVIELRSLSGVVQSIYVSLGNITGRFLDPTQNYTNPYIPLYPGSPATKKYVDDIISSIVIPTYVAGPGIEIGQIESYLAMQGPCDDGFHVPSKDEREDVTTMGRTMGIFGTNQRDVADYTAYLKVPAAGYLYYQNGGLTGVGNFLIYWTNTSVTGDTKAYMYGGLIAGTGGASATAWEISMGLPVRPFKDIPVEPDSTWTTLLDGSSVATGAGVFWDENEGLISISSDGQTWITLADKNIGATNVGDLGNYFQRGNNNEFVSGSVTTSSTTVDTSSYGPSEFSSNTFITAAPWSNPFNDDLWGGTTGIIQADNAIINTGVLSVNGQTGDVVVDESNTKTFYLSSTSDLTTAQAAYDRWKAGKTPFIVYQDVCYSLSGYGNYTLTFYSAKNTDAYSSSGEFSTEGQLLVWFQTSGDTVTNIIARDHQHIAYIEPNTNYTTPYIPQYPGSPATKKYVDDRDTYIGTSAPINNLVEGRLWYDTTNDVLKVYDGTNWNNVDTDTTYTAGTGINISQNNEISADTTVLATKQDIANLGNFEVVATLPSVDTADTKTIYLLGPIGTGADKYEERIVTVRTELITFESDGEEYSIYYTPRTITFSEPTTLTFNSKTGGGRIEFVDYNNDKSYTYADAGEVHDWDPSVQLEGWYHSDSTAIDDDTMIYVDANSCTLPAGTYSIEVYDSYGERYDEISFNKQSGRVWTKIGETSIDLTDYAQKSEVLVKTNTTSYVPSGDYNPATKKYVDDSISAITIPTVNDATLTVTQNGVSAGTFTANASNNTTIALTDTTYTAGDGIAILNGFNYSAMRGPCDEGYHIPSEDENTALKDTLTVLGIDTSNGNCLKTYLKMPFAGYRDSGANTTSQGSSANYWSSTPKSTSSACYLYSFSSSFTTHNGSSRSTGCSIRPFKDVSIIPDNNWTVLYQGTGGAGIFYNNTLGVISLSGDGTNWITIADKNLGATIVYSDGDTLSQANCGKYYQWGNNYGFDWAGNITTSSTQIDSTGYGPGNYYSDSTFITGGRDRSSVQNDNLRGGETGVVQLSNAITNTGVLSVNGLTGNVTVEGLTYTAGTGISINSSSVISNTGVTSVNGQVGDVSVDESTKTFYLSSTSDLTTAQDVLDWCLAGKNAIIILTTDNDGGISRGTYLFRNNSGNSLTFYQSVISENDGATHTAITNAFLQIDYSTDTVTQVRRIGPDTQYQVGVLATGCNYATPYTPEYAGSPATKKYVDDSISAITIPTYTAGTNVSIDANNVISATDTTYIAGTGINISDYADYSAMRGPAPEGYHVPSVGEFRQIRDILDDLGIDSSAINSLKTYLKLPSAGALLQYGVYFRGDDNSGFSYRACTATTNHNVQYADQLDYRNGTVYYDDNSGRGNCIPIRAFKDNPVIPNAQWTVLYDGSTIATGAGIFHSSTLGLISLSSDGQNRLTIADKNLGATVVYNNGDTLIDNNCGGYFQWGNNYMFPGVRPESIISTPIDASGYGPGNYYSSSDYYYVNNSDNDWDSTHNKNLRGGVTGIVQLQNIITNTGVLSVNGQTGHVTVQSGGGGVLIGGETLADKGTNFANYLNSINFTPNAAESIGFVGILDGRPYYLQNMYYITQDVQYRFIFESIATSSGNVSNQSSRTYHELRRIVLDYDSTSETWSYNSSDSTYIATTADKVLRIDQDYSNPYIPLYDGSPATKKYVDSKIIASSTSPSSPAEGMLWYDTTNDTLYSYDGSNRQIVGSGGGSSVQSNWTQTDSTAADYIKNKPNLATVATSGSYNDLSNKPIIPTVYNGTLTIQKNGTTVDTFTANSSSNKTVNITVPTTTSELTNNSGFITSSSIPSVGNGTITIKQGGVQKGTFTTNQSGNTTINLDAGGGAERYVQGGTRCLVHSVVNNDGTAESFYIGGENRDWAVANISFFCSSSSTQFEGHIHLAPFSFSSVYKSYNSSGTNVSYDYDNDIDFSSFQRVCTIRKAGDTSKYLFVNIKTSGNKIYIESGNRLGESATFYYTVGGVYGDLTY